jgi:DNA ligase (NAD+)
MKFGVKIHYEQKKAGKLIGKTFVITGTLESMSRGEAKSKVKSLGGKISESVSKLTSYVVVGNDPGSKYDKAQKLGVKILDEKKFLELVKQ